MQGRALQLSVHLWGHPTCLLQVIKALIQNEKVRGWYFKTVFILHFLHWARLFLPHSRLWEVANAFVSKKVYDCSSLSSTWPLEANCFHFGAPKQWLSMAPQAYPQVSWSRKTRTSSLESKAIGDHVLHLAWLQYHSCPWRMKMRLQGCWNNRRKFTWPGQITEIFWSIYIPI